MAIRTEVLHSFYQDSVVLMRVASAIRARQGVREAAAFMGTPANQDLLEQNRLATPESRAAHPDDLILAVDAADDAVAVEALGAARTLLTERKQAAGTNTRMRPRTLDAGLRALPGANLAAISVPGAYAAFEARRALRAGLHVFLFSDNVPVHEEIALKREAVNRGLLCMGPDCGTAYLNGTGLGFANTVPRGRIGCVAASGTGLQAVACRITGLGEGISQGIGVGGRDLSKHVDGMMTLFALQALAQDRTTEAIVVISKSAHPDVLPKIQAALDATGKPVVVCMLGVKFGGGKAMWVETVDQAADAVVARVSDRSWSPRPFSDPAAIRTALAGIGSGVTGKAALGLYTGGTLAHEAHLILDDLLGPSDTNRVLDLGDDAYTVGRPHPMIDPQPRTDLLRKAADDSRIGVLLVDLVLGTGSHPNPAEPLATGFEQARAHAAASGRTLVGVASVVGTSGDGQGLTRQIERLKSAGFVVLPTNAEAARFAALMVNPELASRMLEDAR